SIARHSHIHPLGGLHRWRRSTITYQPGIGGKPYGSFQVLWRRMKAVATIGWQRMILKPYSKKGWWRNTNTIKKPLTNCFLRPSTLRGLHYLSRITTVLVWPMRKSLCLKGDNG